MSQTPRSGRSERSARTRERDERKTEQTYLSRRKLVQGVFGIGVLGVLWKLTDYQIVKRDYYVAKADERRIGTKQVLFAKRGTIYDRNGNVLVSSEECSNVYVNPQNIEDVDAATAALVDVLGVDEDTCRELCSQDAQFVYIQRGVSNDDVEKLEEKGITGIGYEDSVKRVYAYGSLASQVLGIVNVDNEGASGLEAYYDDVLSGENGSLIRERGINGEYIAGGAYEKVPATDGTDIVLTLDVTIQQVAEEALAQVVKNSGAKYGSAVAMDPTTGEILAACSYPTYDQENLDEVDYEDMKLRIVTDAYEPGSVFKTFVTGAAIDLGLITSETSFTVPPMVMAGDDEVRDHDLRDYTATMTTRDIIRRSSNTGMVLIGQKIGADKFAKYLKTYGFGKKIGIDFPGESKGIVKDRDEYDGASVAAMSFGQSLSVTPVQVMHAASGLANAGIMSIPHFLKSKQGEEIDWDSKQKRCISKDAAAQVASMMQTVVDDGTEATAARISGYVVAGKTGTAERASDDGSYEEGSYMASFLGFVSPNSPKAMVYVTLDGTANMAAAAIPAFTSIMQSCIDVLGIQPER